MSIDKVYCNGRPVGALLRGSHGTLNMLDEYGKQRGLTSPYYVEGDRDAAHPVIEFILAYIGNHGNITPIATLEFDVVDAAGNTSQHVTMRNCTVTAWSLTAPEQPDGAAVVHPDVEHFRIESTDVEIEAGGEKAPYKREDPNRSK
jgi:hypothetical protein